MIPTNEMYQFLYNYLTQSMWLLITHLKRRITNIYFGVCQFDFLDTVLK